MKLPLVSKLFRRQKNEHFTAVDLGSSVIDVAIFKPVTELEPVKVLGLGNQVQGQSSMFGGRILDLDAVIETLNLAMEEAALKAGLSSPQLILGLSGGVLFPRGLRVRTRRNHPDQPLTEEEFEMLAEHIEKRTLDQVLGELKQSHHSDYERVETRFTSYLVDGARVTTPIGLPGNELEIGVLHYFAEPNRLRLVNSLVSQLNLEVVSLVDTATTLAVDRSEKYGDFVLVDIGGMVTEVVVVQSGKVIGVENVFIGGNDITTQVQEDMGLTHDKAEMLKINYGQGFLDQDRSRDVKQSVNKVAEWLIEGVAMSLEGMDNRNLPDQIVLAGESRHLEEIKSAFAAYPWNKVLTLGSFPKIEVEEGQLPAIHALTRVET